MCINYLLVISLLSILFSAQKSVAQQNEVSGWYLNNDSNKVETTFIIEEDLLNFNSLKIKRADGTIDRIGIENAQYLFLDYPNKRKLRYQRLRMVLDYAITSPDKPAPSQGYDRRVETFYAEPIILGDISYYTHKDSAGKLHHIFHIAAMDTLVEIDQKFYTISQNESDKVRATEAYKSILFTATADCDAITFSRINDIRINVSELKEFVKTYNSECGELIPMRDYSVGKGVRFHPFIGGGITLTNLSITNDPIFSYRDVDFDTYTSYAISAGSELRLSSYITGLIGHLALEFTKFEGSADFVHEQLGPDRFLEANINYNAISLVLGFYQRIINENSLKFYLGGGPTFSLINSNETFYFDGNDSTTSTGIEVLNDDSYTNPAVQLRLGALFRLPRVDVLFGYSIGGGFIEDGDVRSKGTGLHGRVLYRLSN